MARVATSEYAKDNQPMKRFDQINVIPFIDIMLVLLAIVLTTATFISQGAIEINLPEAESAVSLPQPSNKKIIEITISAQSELFLDAKKINKQELAEKLQKTNTQTPVLLRVDKKVAFENFVGVIDVLKKYKLEKLTIVTKEGKQ
jgi:biopolymer transport protein ExbD